jgi:uncharacterized protein (TIGR04255 family)
VVEVVCGVAFDAPSGFTAAHLGRFWVELGDAFSEVKEVAPLVREQPRSSPSEAFTPQVGTQMPRIWFISAAKDHLVQVQRDRFLTNWRKLEPEHKYPSFDWVRGKFEEDLKRFETFAAQHFAGPPA